MQQAPWFVVVLTRTERGGGMKEGEELEGAARTKKAPRPSAHPPRGKTRTMAPNTPHLSPDDTREAAETCRRPPSTPWRDPDDALAARRSVAAVDRGQRQHVTTEVAVDGSGSRQWLTTATTVNGGDSQLLQPQGIQIILILSHRNNQIPNLGSVCVPPPTRMGLFISPCSIGRTDRRTVDDDVVHSKHH